MTPCLDENDATAFLRGAVDATTRERVDAHVDACEDCLDLLASLAAVEAAERPADEPPLRLARGATLGRYALLELVGVGGMGLVYAAYDPELDRNVALKLIVSERGTAAAAAIIREARVMAQLRHPNVVTVHDLGSFDSGVFLAMELVVGTTLSEWCRATNRPVAEILASFVEAGRGLDAAHRAGIVHRDFKPDNVLVDASAAGQRRVVVTDFGLATGQGTDAHVVAGTPYFMAPEQRQGAPSDARADQYAFCVALRDALVGAPGSSMSSLRGVPGVRPRTVRAIARGLADAPDDRWASMTDLLAELARPAVARWKRVLVLSLAILSTLIVIAATHRVRIEQRIECERRTRTIDRLWSASEKEAVRRGMLGVTASFAAEEWSRVERILSGYVASARRASVELCRSEPAPEIFTLRATCLDQRLDQVRDFVEMLEHADVATVGKATKSADLLGRPEDCFDASKLLRAASSRSDRETARAMAKARILLIVGKPSEAEKVTEEATRRAEASGDRRSAAAAHASWADLASGLGRVEAAEEHAVRAERLAESVGADRTRARALIAQMNIAAGHHRDLTRTLELDQRARLVLERLGGDDNLESARLGILGDLHLDLGNASEALPLFERSLELRRRLFGPKTAEVAFLLTDVAGAAVEVGNLQLARDSQNEAIGIVTETFGPRFVRLAPAFQNLGAAALASGRFEEASAEYARALSIAEEARGPNHRLVASILDGLGDVETRRGRPADAVPLLVRALSIVERTYGVGHTRTQETLQLLGLAHAALGERDRAIELLSRAESLGDLGSRSLRARAKFALARALSDAHARGSRSRSRALVASALELVRGMEWQDLETKKAEKEMAQWMQHHEKRASR